MVLGWPVGTNGQLNYCCLRMGEGVGAKWRRWYVLRMTLKGMWYLHIYISVFFSVAHAAELRFDIFSLEFYNHVM